MILNKQKRKLQAALILFRPYLNKTLTRMGILFFLIILVSQKEVSFHFSIGGKQTTPINTSPKKLEKTVPLPASEKKPKKIQRTSILP